MEPTVPERYGAYRVFEQLGQGGMATVHRAEMDTKQGVRQVALKRLMPTTDRRLTNLFLDEARLLRYLHHPNIPETYDSGRIFGTYYIAMEYVDGRTLKDLIAHCSRIVGPVPQAITLNLALQLCEALDYAHKRSDEHGRPLGIVHRDVTPANLILDRTGVLKLVDFGLTKATVSTEPSSSGVLKGKVGYVAPEYTRGKLDPRADLWAVGIILYEMLTGRRLFDGEHAHDTIERVRSLPIPRPSMANPSVAKEVDEIVMTALERDPRQRWPSAATMRDRIRVVSSQLGEPADNGKVNEWVSWALGQNQPRVIQLTPIIPMPIRAAPIVTSAGQPSYPVAPAAGWTPKKLALVCGIVLLAILALAVKLHR